MAIRPEYGLGWPKPGEPGLVWLGQAGFWIETGAHRILIDPYLSESLARKYAGHRNDHRRMMPPPILPDDLPAPDIVLITHAHTDHMDPDTLGPIAQRFPSVPFVVPAARVETARQRIGPDARLIAVNAGQSLSPLAGLELSALPAAHETLERDPEGRYHFLGYAIRSGGYCFFHSGDTIPFSGQSDLVLDLAADIALFPVNGRDEARLATGIPGNFTLAEAILLAHEARIPFLIPHHFGMFAFNTLDEAQIECAAAGTSDPQILKPVAGGVIFLRERADGPNAPSRS